MDSAAVFMEKATALINQYVNTYGKVMLGRYIFPEIDRTGFFTFLDCSRVVMTRRGLCPNYVWLYDAEQHCYHVLLLCNGYFRTNADEATQCFQRLWALRSSQPFHIVDSSIIDNSTTQAVQRQLAGDWNNLVPHIRRSEWHQRTWGTSRLQAV